MTTEPQRKRGPTKVWLPAILAAGIFAGVILSFFVPEPAPFFFWRYAPFELQLALMLHVIFSTVSIALLVALSVIYTKVYAETGARFSLGITIVLLALLVQSLIQYPLFLGLMGPFEQIQDQFLSFADIFTILAYTIFLYLSLE